MNEFTWPAKTAPAPAALEYAIFRMPDLPESWLNQQAAMGYTLEAVVAQGNGFLVIFSRPRPAATETTNA
jgi:hypothetical protein